MIPQTPVCRTMYMVLRYRGKGMIPLWEIEGRSLKVFKMFSSWNL